MKAKKSHLKGWQEKENPHWAGKGYSINLRALAIVDRHTARS